MTAAVSSAAWYRPAEWARHARTILAWPGAQTPSYRAVPGSLARATRDVSAIARAVARFEPVTLVVERRRLAEARRQFVPGAAAHRTSAHEVRLHAVDGDQLDLWMRDIAPTFVVAADDHGAAADGPARRRAVHGVDFNFNGWGKRFDSATCAALARTLLHDTQTARVESCIVTEGGALEVDGQGTLLATASSIVNANRNPGRSRHDIETELRRTLAVDTFVWIPGVCGADVTDCHIDALARFVRPGLVLLSRPAARHADDVWTRAYREARRVLSTATDARGRPLETVEVAEADVGAIGLGHAYLRALSAGEQARPALSYVNYLLVNGGLILPQFGDAESDAAALETAKQLFGRDREVVPVAIRELPLIGGGIHCATQEVPSTEP